MFSFFAIGFAIAGAVAAGGPIVIHLLNRRRFRVVNWAAMDFLREALERNRRMLHLRDLLLLALRTACLLLFGLAMARPYVTGNVGLASIGAFVAILLVGLVGLGALWINQPKAVGTRIATFAAIPVIVVAGWLLLKNAFVPEGSAVAQLDQPLHAVLIVDNSLSMGYERFNQPLLEEAKAKAAEYIERLPQGSRISVLPLCGSAGEFSRDAYRTPQDALEALKSIQVVDRAASAEQAIDMAREALDRVRDLDSKRVVFLGDQQVGNWPAESLATALKDLPEMQVVQIAAESPENSWIADFKLQDGIADVEAPSAFVVTVRHTGKTSRSGVPVTLVVDGIADKPRIVDLEPEQTREILFPFHFDTQVEPGRPQFVTAEVSIPADSNDRLAGDNQRSLVVPVVAALPVVFIDQYGEDEDTKTFHFGETFALRRLLAPVTTRGDTARQLIQVRHAKWDQIDRELIQDARLVVVAGVERPDVATVELLRDYVKQGGQLVICAGAAFDPAAWTKTAWLAGAGILPAPLEAEPVGQVPEEATKQLLMFHLAFSSMVHDHFRIPENSDESLKDLFQSPYFFKAVSANTGDAALAELVKTETQRIDADRQFMAETNERRKKWAELEGKGAMQASERAIRDADDRRLAEMNPNWLLWPRERLGGDGDVPSKELAERSRPRVLAMFDNQMPFLIERSIGDGQVLLVTSGVQSSWNTIIKTRAVVMFDRILRSMLERTLPRRNRDSVETIMLPVEPSDRRGRFTLVRPDNVREPLSVDALGADSYGVMVRNAVERGIYRVTAYRADTGPTDAATGSPANTSEALVDKLWEMPLAINGPESESELKVLDEEGLRQRLGEANYRWVAQGEQISLEGAKIRGQNWWKGLMFFVLIGLIVEMGILVWPVLAKERATQ